MKDSKKNLINFNIWNYSAFSYQKPPVPVDGFKPGGPPKSTAPGAAEKISKASKEN